MFITAVIALLVAVAAIAFGVHERQARMRLASRSDNSSLPMEHSEEVTEPAEAAARISHVVDLYLEVTATGLKSSPAALLRAGAALLHNDAEIRDAARQISQYTGRDPLEFLRAFPTVSPKDFLRTALVDSMHLLEQTEINDLASRLVRGLLQARMAEAASQEEGRVTAVLGDFDHRLKLTVEAMKPLTALLQQVRESLDVGAEVSFSFPQAGHMASVKIGESGSTTDLRFTFEPERGHYRVETTTHYFYAGGGSHHKMDTAPDAPGAVEYATRAIGAYLGSRAAHAKRNSLKTHSAEIRGPDA